MKIQCHCGAKYEFEIYAGMSREPVEFRCPTCRTDLSPYLNELIRRELGELEAVTATASVSAAPASVSAPAAPSMPAPAPAPAPVPVAAAPRAVTPAPAAAPAPTTA